MHTQGAFRTRRTRLRLLARSTAASMKIVHRAQKALLVLLGVALAALTAPTLALADTPFDLTLPRGFPPPEIPEDNPLTWEKIELGRFLFYDTRLSGNGAQSCAHCHQQALAFTDGRAQAEGSTHEIHPRGSMSLANVAYASTMAWANPSPPHTLEHQMLTPMFGTEPVELGLSGKEEELFARLRADPRYQRLFAEAFPDDADPVNLASITRSIASFERILLSGRSPYDRYRYGEDDDAISSAAKRGESLFFDEPPSLIKRECNHCHGGFNFTASIDHQNQVAERPFRNNALYNLRCADVGLPPLELTQCSTDPPSSPLCEGSGPQAMGCYPPPNTGKYASTDEDNDMGRFKAPTLRNIGVTAPYMHDGSIATLEEVIDHYAAGGRTLTDGPYAGDGSANPNKGGFLAGFELSERDKTDLIEFLKSLTDDEFLNNPRFANPFGPVSCPSDCNFDGAVEVSELITSINTSLGTSSLALCVVGDPNGDGAVNIDELLRAIRGALNGCE